MAPPGDSTVPEDGGGIQAVLDSLARTGYRAAYRLLLTYWWLVRPTEVGCHVAVRWEGRVLLIRNSYRPFYSLPAGRARRREAPAVAAARELAEEVGIRASPGALRFERFLVSRHEHKRDESYFYGLDLESRPTVCIDRREVVWADFVPLSEARDLALAPSVREFLFGEGPRREPRPAGA